MDNYDIVYNVMYGMEPGSDTERDSFSSVVSNLISATSLLVGDELEVIFGCNEENSKVAYAFQLESEKIYMRPLTNKPYTYRTEFFGDRTLYQLIKMFDCKVKKFPNKDGIELFEYEVGSDAKHLTQGYDFYNQTGIYQRTPRIKVLVGISNEFVSEMDKKLKIKIEEIKREVDSNNDNLDKFNGECLNELDKYSYCMRLKENTTPNILKIHMQLNKK